MFENLINKHVKCVWKDGDNYKAAYGILKQINNEDKFIEIDTDKEGNLNLAFSGIVILKEAQI